MPPYRGRKKSHSSNASCGSSICSYVSFECTERPGGLIEDAFEIKLMTGIQTLEIPASKTASALETLPRAWDDNNGSNMTIENLEAFELIEFERWTHLLNAVNSRPDLASFPYPPESNPAFAPNSLPGRFLPQSVGNLLLHQACQYDPPIEVIQTLLIAYPKAIEMSGHGGLLPLHVACSCGASFEVIAALLAEKPTTVKVPCQIGHDGHMLPLHIASRRSAHPDVLKILLAYYPEASAIRDRHGNLPMQYANEIINPITRRDALKCLEDGEIMRVTADATCALLDSERECRTADNNEAYEVMITAIKSKYQNAIEELNSQLIDMEFEKTTARDELDASKAEMELLMESFQEYKTSQQDKYMKLQETSRLKDVETQESHELERKNLQTQIEESNEKLQKLQEETESTSSDNQRLKVHCEEQQKLYDTIRDAEQKHFGATLTESLNAQKELEKKVQELEKANSMQCRLLNRMSTIANEERERANKRLIELIMNLSRQKEPKEDLVYTLNSREEPSGERCPKMFGDNGVLATGSWECEEESKLF